MRLSETTLDQSPHVAGPGYDRRQGVGIVHFGIGAFHRAHQAWYTDACLREGEGGWMIAGVSLRSRGVADQLNPQDGLYTLTQRSAAGQETRTIGAIREVLVAGPDHARIVDRIASPDCRIVSFTITEKGYCRAADGSLDRTMAAGGFFPILAEGLAKRRAAGLPGLTLLSCDNLSANGKTLGRLMNEWLEVDADLAAWFAAECTTPDTMVDRIVPATTPDDIAALEQRIGFVDEGAVFTEPFSQWVVEDAFAGPRPGWEGHGVQVVSDVAPYETAKLRMLNGAHSALAYLGLQRGHSFVHEAIADPAIRAIVERLMRVEAATSFVPAPQQDLWRYADDLLARFANPKLHHRLIQIAMDGSQKVPQRWFETLAAHQREGVRCPAILSALAAWLCHLRGDNEAQWGPVDDPMAETLGAILANASPAEAIQRILGPEGALSTDWQPSSEDIEILCRAIVTAPETQALS